MTHPRYVSPDRKALQALNEMAHDARRVLGSDHPLFPQLLTVMRLTDALVDAAAPSIPMEVE